MINLKKSKLKIKKKPPSSFSHKIYRFFTDFNILKTDENFKGSLFSLFFNIYILNRYDLIRIKEKGSMLATILIKKIKAEEGILIKIFHTSDTTNITNKELLQNIKLAFLQYGTLGYEKIIIELKSTDYAKKNFFEEWLGFNEDTAKRLIYLTKGHFKIILFKNLQ